ncbi:MAG TPA: L,D-transpeptidase [Anaerolineales bacterium]|nr:L,D-transpeptidase [Anaerolineales bacterium]
MKLYKQRVSYQRASAHRQGVKKQSRLFPTLLVGAMFLSVVLAALFFVTSSAFASITGGINTPAPVQEILWAEVEIAKPSIQRKDTGVSIAPLSSPTDSLGLGDTETPTLTPEATETPGTLLMEIVPDDSTGQTIEIDNAQSQYSAESQTERWIDVNLSEQRVYAYEGDRLVNSFLASTGLADTPTVTGTFNVWIKVRIQDMFGPGYYLPDVPYVMYFYEDYGLHGTYWHDNFGTPMSRGCVNLTIDDAAWLFGWASVGTVVNVHY